MRIAVGLTVVGGLLAVVSTLLGAGQFAVLCVAAMFTGAGANIGLITIQRTAGRAANDATELRRVFSWLGLAPALSNVIGPVLAGTLIDLGGFRVAFVALMLLPLLGLWWARRVPVEVPAPRAPAPRKHGSWDLLSAPGLRRLLLVNWLLSSSWDVHTFVVPILGHERGFSASAIGLVLGVFATAVALVRLVIPALAHRLRESQVLVGAMLCTGLVFTVYPFVRTAWMMGVCAVLPRPRARRGAADDHDHAAPDHAARAARRGDRAALDDDQFLECGDAAGVRPGRRGAGRGVAVLGDGRGGQRRQRSGAAHRQGRRLSGGHASRRVRT